MKYRIQIQQIYGGNWSTMEEATQHANWLQFADIKPRNRNQAFEALEKQANTVKNGAPHRLVAINTDGTFEVIETITRGTAFFPEPARLTPETNPTTCSHEIVQGACHACGQPVDATVFAPVRVPTLKIDGLLFKDRTMPAHCKIERRIVANLIAHMAFHGWAVQSVWDGEEDEKVSDMVSAMELVFNLDECRIYFKKADRSHNVLLVLGNGVDCIADWAYADGDDFNSVMERFDCEEYV